MTDSRKTCSYSQQKNPRNCSLYPIEKEKIMTKTRYVVMV